MIQSLADEMSRELAQIKHDALQSAEAGNETITVDLLTKNISFGRITARADGSIDTTEIEGIDDDLIVRPFGWKGEFATLRAFLEDASRIHFGIQSHGLALATKTVQIPMSWAEGDWWDPDDDGIEREIEVGTATAGAVCWHCLNRRLSSRPMTRVYETSGLGDQRYSTRSNAQMSCAYTFADLFEMDRGAEHGTG